MKMNKTWNLVLLVGCLLSALYSAQCEVRNLRLFDELDKYWHKIAEFQPQVERISEYLRNNVTDPYDRQKSMEALEDLASESAEDLPRHQAIMVIIALKTVLHSNCDGPSYIKLAEAYLLIGGEPENFDDSNLNRVEQLVLGYGRDHKKLCLPKYLDKFEAQVGNLKEGTQLTADIAKLRKLFCHEFVKRLSGAKGASNSANILEVKLTKFRVYDSVLLRQLMDNIKATIGPSTDSNDDDDNDEEEKETDEMAAYYVDRLKGPCERYTEAFGDIFKATKFDVMLFHGKPSELCKDLESNFCNHWKLFRTCEAYVKAKRSKLTAKIGLIIERTTKRD